MFYCKSFAFTNSSAKFAKLFYLGQFAIYGISLQLSPSIKNWLYDMPEVMLFKLEIGTFYLHHVTTDDVLVKPHYE